MDIEQINDDIVLSVEQNIGRRTSKKDIKNPWVAQQEVGSKNMD